MQSTRLLKYVNGRGKRSGSILTAVLTGAGVLLLFSLASCRIDPEIPVPENTYALQVPEGFPYPPIPDDNPLTAAKIVLGKRLFFDPVLSIDSTISCAHCHRPEYAFSDNMPLSMGVGGALGFRNAPTLTNVAYVSPLMHDGGFPSLEAQVHVPVESPIEMDFNTLMLIERLRNIPDYVNAFEEVFGGPPDQFCLTSAIAAFERTLISGNAPYDQYAFQGNMQALNPSQKAGMDLFFSNRTQCSGCHGGFLFTDNSFRNDGMFASYDSDSGRARITGLHSDYGKFRVPTLRNISLTAPYMHDGSMATLQEVLNVYMAGGMHPDNQDSLIRPFILSAEEQQELIDFLGALTDTTFVNDPAFRP